ncbi:MAG: type I-C CRISPR-associated protein Cas5 [Pusillimonas sp.]|nr:type I-C CRISPR-associated protein Cas5 [Pusillimonas sp.]
MGFCIEVHGDFACFTRPEMKVERVSYDIITPSAARAIFEAILWKPAIVWRITRIEVLKPIKWTNLRRNEISAVASAKNAKTAMTKGKGHLGIYVDENRQQRAGLFLRDVAYRLHGSFEMTDRAGAEDTAAKFAEMFQRRARKGQCFNQPYLGCREFSCDFTLVADDEPTVQPITESRDLGWILYDLDYSNKVDPQPLFFKANMKKGVVQVPPRDSAEVRG